MPARPTDPGVYVEEIPSGVRSINGVATSITAFIGRALRGPVDEPIRVRSFADFDRHFGGLWTESMMSFSVGHYFLNGGSEGLIVRVTDGAAQAAGFALPAASSVLRLEAASPGQWGNRLGIFVTHGTRGSSRTRPSPGLFSLAVNEVDESGEILASERFDDVSIEPGAPNSVARILERGSNLVRVIGSLPDCRPDETPLDRRGVSRPASRTTDGSDGGAIGHDEIAAPGLEADSRGLWALAKADLFNLLCIPPFEAETDTSPETWTAALAYCKQRRAMLIVDPPTGWHDPEDLTDPTTGVDGTGSSVPARDPNSMLYFPRVQIDEPGGQGDLATFAPCGLIAGVCARTDAQRGVWKAPAGQDAVLLGVRGLTHETTEAENGLLNPLAVNALRRFPAAGYVVWGARTTAGANQSASEWRYIPVRRLALFLEESLDRGTRWVVFEPNDEPLWAEIRLNVGAFMQTLFRQGAFQGSTAKEAYFVKCDAETTTQSDQDQGIVNILVGFAPVRPAEFVIVRISQSAGGS